MGWLLHGIPSHHCECGSRGDGARETDHHIIHEETSTPLSSQGAPISPKTHDPSTVAAAAIPTPPSQEAQGEDHALLGLVWAEC